MVLNFVDFNGFNKLDSFKNGDMIILPTGLYQKVTNDYVKYLKLVTLFNEGQYEQSLNNLDEGTKRHMQSLVNLQPSEAFEIVKCPSGDSSTQESIYNTALNYLQSPALGNRTFKIQLYLEKQTDGKGAFIAYVPVQYSDAKDKRLSELKSKAYLLAEYYFSQGDINANEVQKEKALIPHMVVMCQNFGENYSLTKDAQYYTISYDPSSEANITNLLDDNLRDDYFLSLRKSLDTEIKRIVGAKKNNSNSIINYKVNPDIVLSKYKKGTKILNSYQNLNLQEPVDDFKDNTQPKQSYHQEDNDFKSGDETMKENNHKKQSTIDEDLLEENTEKDKNKKETVIVTPPMDGEKSSHHDSKNIKQDSNDDDEKDNPFVNTEEEPEEVFGDDDWDE